jgi:hypothetical protein
MSGVYPRSRVEIGETRLWLARRDEGKRLIVQGPARGLVGERHGDLLVCPLTAENAATLREWIPWLCPQPLGLKRSVGCGDRLGLATPGHIRAVRKTDDFALIPAQQSMRENERTGRTPQEVLDDAMWGVLQEGWREPWGADADHLKTTEDVDLCVEAGYTFYTVDPGDEVDNEAHTDSPAILKAKVDALPWDVLDISPEGLEEHYLGHRFEVEALIVEFDQVSLARAAAKYGRAIAHTVKMYRHLAATMGHRTFELEVSVDETETPTSVQEHYFVASELARLGVRWVSLAPRYIGRFEKGVDYIGNLDLFDGELAKHAAIARALGPYKLSIHSGSDKFRVYPSFARHGRELVHLKTAGTSYLEGLRAVAGVDAELFRQILDFARQRYEQDRATYHVSANLGRVARSEDLADEDLVGVLDQFDGREVLHVTFGSVAERFGDRLLATLAEHEEAYYAALETHFERHLMSFLPSAPMAGGGI